MNIGMYGILFVFGAFTLLLILNPKLSCFGKRLKSPLYPILRKKSLKKRKQVKTTDYGFDLGGGASKKFQKKEMNGSKKIKIQDYGFDLHNGKTENQEKDAEKTNTIKQKIL